MIEAVAAIVCLIWYLVVLSVSTIGITQIFKYYSAPPSDEHGSAGNGDEGVAPFVTIIRPIKGLDPGLYECLASTFIQTYPRSRLRVHLCLENDQDPAYCVAEKVIEDFPFVASRIFLGSNDPRLEDKAVSLGPNPKIRQVSRAYSEAPDGLVWMIDCNVWVSKGACSRMVKKLVGDRGAKPYKLVHHLPLVVNSSMYSPVETTGMVSSSQNAELVAKLAMLQREDTTGSTPFLPTFGGRLEEMFMSTSHPKFYTAINRVGIAPCIVGKSTMIRKGHLDLLTNGEGLDFFSHNICEDHLIGDLLWRRPVPNTLSNGRQWGNHGMVYGDLALQPMARMSAGSYISRRLRWLRVRKYTVFLATLVEPGTESMLCSLYGAYAVTTLPWFNEVMGVPQTWTVFWMIWLASVALWCVSDRVLYKKLHSASSIRLDEDSPSFVLPQDPDERAIGPWLLAWLGREVLALPIWFTAFYLGATVVWRGKKFWVDTSMVVHAIEEQESSGAKQKKEI